MGQCNVDAQDRLVQTELNEAKRDLAIDHKLLLLGAGAGGKSTFFKQLCQIHGDGFQKQDLEGARQHIYGCTLDQMEQLVELCLENIQSQQDDAKSYHSHQFILSPQGKEAADYILSHRVGVEVDTEVAEFITILWNEPSIKETFNTRTNLGVIDSAYHFFENIDRIATNEYVPTDQDILLVRVPTTGVRSASFTVDGSQFTLVDVGGQRNERNKWVHQFSIVDAVLFVASLSCYDQQLFEAHDTNAMHESVRLFDLIVNNRYFKGTSMILFLNKWDLFEIKIQTKSIKCCFPEFDGADGDNASALRYIKDIFLACNRANRNSETTKNRRVYTHVTTATDPNNVRSVFHDVEHTVITASLQNIGMT
eukprot:194952_1